MHKFFGNREAVYVDLRRIEAVRTSENIKGGSLIHTHSGEAFHVTVAPGEVVAMVCDAKGVYATE